MAKNAVATTLSSLKFSTVSRPLKSVTKTPRQIVLDFIDQQIGIATADLEGREFAVTKNRYSQDETGRTLKTSVQATPRRYFWQANGGWLVEVRYGNSVLELAPGFPAIVAGSDLQGVISTLATVRKAVEAGEADDAIQAAAEKARRRRTA